LTDETIRDRKTEFKIVDAVDSQSVLLLGMIG